MKPKLLFYIFPILLLISLFSVTKVSALTCTSDTIINGDYCSSVNGESWCGGICRIEPDQTEQNSCSGGMTWNCETCGCACPSGTTNCSGTCTTTVAPTGQCASYDTCNNRCASCNSGYGLCSSTFLCVANTCSPGQTFDACTGLCSGFAGLKLGSDSNSGTSIIQSPSLSSFYIPSNGFIGIGTSNPSGNLQIHGAAGTGINPTFKISDQDFNNPFTSIDSDTKSAGKLSVVGSSGGGLLFDGYSSSGNNPALIFRGLIGSTAPTQPALAFRVGKLSGTTYQNIGALETAFQFQNPGADTNYLTILGSGKIGIGTTTPNDLLTIGANNATSSQSSLGTGHNSTQGYNSDDEYALANVGYVKAVVNPIIINSLWGGTKNGNIYNGDAGAGNVGIGTTNPGAKLEVASGTNKFLFDPATALISSPNSLDIKLQANGQNIFRGLDAWNGTWSDAVATTYFQTGRSGGNTAFSSYSGAPYNRLAFLTNKFQVTNTNSSVTPPTNFFQIDYNNANLFSVKSDGKVGVGTTTPANLLHVFGNTTLGPLSGYPFNSSWTWTSDNSGYYSGIGYQSTADSSKKLYAWWIDNVVETNINSVLNVAAPGHVFDGTAPNSGRTIGIKLVSSGNSYFSGGNVGIGVTNPGSLLQVNNNSLGTTATDAVSLVNSTAAISGSQQVSPSLKLSAQGYATTPANSQSAEMFLDSYPIQGASTPLPYLRIGHKVAGGSYVSDLLIGNDAADASYTAFYPGGVVPSGSNYIFEVNKAGGPVYFNSPSAASGAIAFAIANSVKMWMNNSGYLGIGTTTPTDKLNIGAYSQGATVQSSIGTGHNSTQGYSSDDVYALANVGYVNGVVGAANYWKLGGNTLGSAVNLGTLSSHDLPIITSSTERMRITDDGNIGIGTSAPSAKLDIESASTSSPATLAIGIPGGAGTATVGALRFQRGPETYAWSGIVGFSTYTDQNGLAFYTTPGGSVAATERMRITQGGNVGIGTVSPDNNKLQVMGNVGIQTGFSNGLLNFAVNSTTTLISSTRTDNTVPGKLMSDGWGNFMFNQKLGVGTTNDLNASTATLYVNGRVGIGLTNPNSQLVVYGTGQTTAALTDAGAKSGTIQLYDSGISGGNGGAITFSAAGGGNSGNPFAAIKSLLSNGSGNSIGDLAFSTRNATSDTALTERMRIEYDGNVGIGIANPSYKLHVSNGTAYGMVGIVAQGLGYGLPTAVNTIADGDKLILQNSGTAKNSIGATGANGIWLQSSALAAGKAFSLYNGISGIAPTEYLTMLGNGNIGISTTSPTDLLNIGTYSQAGTVQSSLGTGHNSTQGYSSDDVYALANVGYVNGVVGAANYWKLGGNTLAVTTNLGTLSAHDLPIITSSTEKMRITTGGNVGIGTSNPIAKLQLGSSWAPNPIGNNNVYLSNSGFANQSIAPEQIITTNSSSLTPGANIGLALHNSNTTAGAYAPLLVFSKTETGSSAYNSAIAAIGARTVTGTGPSDQWIDGELMFFTAPTAGLGLLERARIDQAGNFGIGTTTPFSKLTVVSGNPALPYSGIGLYSGTSGQYTSYTVGRTSVDGYFGVSAGTDHYIYGSAAGDVIIDSVSGKVIIGTGPIVGTAGLTVSAGNIGVGTTTPGAKLDVYNGNTKLWHGGTSEYTIFNSANEINHYTAANAGAPLYIQYSSNSNTNIGKGALYVGGNNGNIGIGTSSPSQKLNIYNGNILVDATSFDSAAQGNIIAKSVVSLSQWREVAQGAAVTTTGGTLSSGGPTARNGKGAWSIDATGQSITLYMAGSWWTRAISFTSATLFESSSVNLKLPGSFLVERSSDGTTWTTVANVTNNTSWYFYSTNIMDARYVRITVNGFQSGQTSAAIANIQVFDAAGFGSGGPFTFNGDGNAVYMGGRVGIGTTTPNDLLNIGPNPYTVNSSYLGTGHNSTVSYDSADSYALTNVGWVKSTLAAATSSLSSAIGLWGGTKDGNIWNGTVGAGNVGIGTTTPSFKLDVFGASRVASEITGTPANLLVQHTLTGTGDQSAYIDVKAENVAKFRGFNADGTQVFNFGYDSNMGAIFTLGYGNSNSINIISGGNVGINTTTPQTKLHVVGDDEPLTDSYSGVAFIGTGSSKVQIGYSAATTPGYGWIAATKNASTWSNLVLMPGGYANVGIGTTNPVNDLDISGTFKATYSSSSIMLDSSGNVLIGI